MDTCVYFMMKNKCYISKMYKEQVLYFKNVCKTSVIFQECMQNKCNISRMYEEQVLYFKNV